MLHTGELGYLIPVLIAVLVAREVGSFFGDSFFDTVIKLRNLPYLRFPKNPANFMLVASQVLVPSTCLMNEPASPTLHHPLSITHSQSPTLNHQQQHLYVLMYHDPRGQPTRTLVMTIGTIHITNPSTGTI